ncbi:MAG: signal recognition particle protein [Gammaproteobacteria bacterium]
MFDNLTESFSRTINWLRGQSHFTEDNIKDALRSVRIALLEADVALSVVMPFIEQVKARAIGQEVKASINPGQAFIKIVQEQLTELMGAQCEQLNLATQPPAIILMAGLQGSGKTTTTAKLARWLKEHQNKRVLVSSADVYRPAAIKQLETLATELDLMFHPSSAEQAPVDIAQAAISAAKKQQADVVIIDTAGRLHIDNDMMDEIKLLHQTVKPIETLFVVDSMTGQDAANTAKAFNDALPLTGVILTKTDGDARGGAALSIRYITGKPIKFIGTGEKTDALDAFYPERIASRILGMGDILSLVEQAERKVDRKKTEKLAKKLKKGKNFDFTDFLVQIEQMQNMGGMMKLMSHLPIGNLPSGIKDQLNDKHVIKIRAIIQSMTYQERQFPKVINGSRKKRIAQGSGTSVQDINKLIKQFEQMQKMMKKMVKPGAMKKMMSKIPGGLPGGLPDDLF